MGERETAADRASWCDGCYRRVRGDADGVPHPTCDAHLEDGSGTASQPVPVGSRMPVTELAWLTAEPPFVVCARGVACTPQGLPIPVTGTGVHVREQDAVRAAIYEVLERQSLYATPAALLRYATADQLASTVHSTQPGYRWWISTERVQDETTEPGWWIPLDWTQLPSARRGGPADRAVDSTGAAVHNDRAAAIGTGVLEHWERRSVRRLCGDTGQDRRRSRPADVPDRLAPYLERLGTTATLRAFLLQAGSAPPVAFAVVVGAVGRAVGGAAAAATEERALERAVAEAYGKAVACGMVGAAPARTVARAPWVPARDAEAALAAAGLDYSLGGRAWIVQHCPVDWPGEAADHFVVDRSTDRIARYGVSAVHVVPAAAPADWRGGEHGATIARLLA